MMITRKQFEAIQSVLKLYKDSKDGRLYRHLINDLKKLDLECLKEISEYKSKSKKKTND